MIAVALWFAWRAFRAPDRAPSAPVDAAGGLSGEEAHVRALALAREGRALAALPYFERAMVVSPGSWVAHHNYASALGNGAQEGRVLLGKEGPATRGSIERVAMTLASLRETEQAISLAPGPSERAAATAERARAFYTWGFPLEAIGEYRRAVELDGSRSDLSRTVEAQEKSLASGGLR